MINKLTHSLTLNGQTVAAAGMLMPANRIIFSTDFPAKHFLLIRFLNLRDEFPFSSESCH